MLRLWEEILYTFYAGVNMQGGEPRSNSWPLLKEFPISIGLWGAHSKNMFWESRNEKGSSEDAMQRSYMLRTERYFTGGTRNPANTPEVTSAMKYNVDNKDWHGMSTWMTAKSTLSWNLTDEPFISYSTLVMVNSLTGWVKERTITLGITLVFKTTCQHGVGGLALVC